MSLRLFALSADQIPVNPAELEVFVRLCERESALSSAAIYVETESLDRADVRSSAQVSRFLERVTCAVLLGTRDRWRALRRQVLSLDVRKPTAAEQANVWKELLHKTPAGKNGCVDALVSQFNLSVGTIRASVRAALPGDADESGLAARLWAASVAQARVRLDDLAHRIDPVAAWDDLVLPPAEMAQLREIAAQVTRRTHVYEKWGFGAKSRRGLGISAMFAGPSGTGKTTAAEVLANALRLDLYRIDLSTVVSKYIGETEKNLRRVFDAAEDGGAILFFDEADALFGKRSEVKDSHDRYANIEISYLLQRMEDYRGLAVLATNAKGSVDAAFLRRIRFVVNFPFPDAAQRADLAAHVPFRRSHRRPRSCPAGAPQRRRRQHQEHRAQRRVPGGRSGRTGRHGPYCAGGARGIRQDGKAADRGGDWRLPMTAHLRIGRRSVPAFQAMGYAGLLSALALGSVLTARAALSWSIMACMAAAAVLTFFVLAMGTKVLTGRERLVYHHHELAVLAVVAAVLTLAGEPPLPYLDVAILGVGVFLAWGRMGCLMAGCCHGRPWNKGVCYPSAYAGTGFTPYYLGVRLFPVQALEAVFVFAIVAAGAVWVWIGRPPGTALAWYVVLYNLGRFVFEFCRGDGDRPYWWLFSEAQWTSLALLWAIAGLEWLGALPFHAWHIGAALTLTAAMVVAAAVRLRSAPYRMLRPDHMQELFEAVHAEPDPLDGIRPRFTSLGLRISQGRILRDGNTVVHYALSLRHGRMTRDTAELLAGAISRLRNEAAGELIASECGVFHVLLPSNPESGLRGGS